MDEQTIAYFLFASLAGLVGGPLALRRGRRHHAEASPDRVAFGQQLAASGARAHLEVLGRPDGPLEQKRSSAARPALPQPAGQPQGRRLRGVLAGGAALAVVSLAALLWAGRDYYFLPRSERLHAALHDTLRPAAWLGLDLGIAATAVMLTNFLYALRKRWRVLAHAGRLSSWLAVHVFVGVLSPAVILFHAAFQANNQLAAFTWVSLGVVVSTGLIGRYLYALVPGDEGRALELADLLAQLERQAARLRPMLRGANCGLALEALLERSSAPPSKAPFPLQLVRSLPELIGFRLRVLGELGAVPVGERATLQQGLLRLSRLRVQAGLFHGIARLMRLWRSVHASLAILLVLALAAHVTLCVYLGYRPG